MPRLLCVIAICLVAFPAFGQSASPYQVATIVDVKTHQAAGDTSDRSSYDISLRVGDTIYLVLYTPQFGIDTVKHKTGHNLLVSVEKKTITYNDLLGQSFEVPIISQRPASDQK